MSNSQVLTQLNACIALCNICFHETLQEGMSGRERCLVLTRDCSDLCLLAASLVTRNSPNADRFLPFVGAVCDACADECLLHPEEHCQRCAEVCRHTAEACGQHHVVDE